MACISMRQNELIPVDSDTKTDKTNVYFKQ